VISVVTHRSHTRKRAADSRITKNETTHQRRMSRRKSGTATVKKGSNLLLETMEDIMKKKASVKKNTKQYFFENFVKKNSTK
jgi:hypothetical protein